MVHRADIRALNQEVSTLIDALDELEDLHAQSEKSGVTVDSTAYAEAQQDVKEAVAALANQSNDMVDRTGVLEDDDGTTLVDLPEAALTRSNSAKLPDSPGGN